MRVVVADTSPLHYLVLIEAIDLLARLFAVVHVPTVVCGELTHPKAPAAVRNWAASLPPWITVSTAPAGAEDSALRALDDGERAAIALAEMIRPDLVLIDERVGAGVAEAKGFAVIGTLGVLRRAAQRDLVGLEAALTALRATNFDVSPALFQRLLAEDRGRRLGS